MKIVFSFFVLAVGMAMISTLPAQKASVSTFKNICGNWQGTLTYIDYTSGDHYTMPAELTIYRIGKTKQFFCETRYPDEPHANGADTLLLSDDGKMWNGARIIEVSRTVRGGMRITTEKEGVDGNENRKASIRHTYDADKGGYSIIKQVKFEGENVWIKRHEYKFARVAAAQ